MSSSCVVITTDGRRVQAGSASKVLRTKGAAIVAYEQTIRQRLLSFLSDPNVVALLMLLGTLGIAIEFYHPGMILPGATGALSLYVRDLPVFDYREALRPSTRLVPRNEEEYEES